MNKPVFIECIVYFKHDKTQTNPFIMSINLNYVKTYQISNDNKEVYINVAEANRISYAKFNGSPAQFLKLIS